MIQPVGYFKLWRELMIKPIWLNSTPEQKAILITLLAMANFNGKEWEWKGEKFKAEKGQFITSLESIAKNSGKGVSIRNIRTALERFEKLEFLTNESTKTGRLITIINWPGYQQDEKETDKATDKDPTKTRQRHDKDPTTREEVKKDKKDKNDIYITIQHLTMSKEEYKKLELEYTKELLDNKIEYALNYAKLKNYKSLYMTLNNWLKADKKKTANDWKNF